MRNFCYEEGDIKIVDCQCELCLHYNEGKRSEECPTAQIEEIQKNMVRCPKMKRKTYFEFDD